GAQPGIERVQAGLGAVLAPEPDGAAALQVADHDAVLVSLGNGDLVDAEDPGSGVAGPAELLAHILLVEFLDRVPIEQEFLGHFLDGGFATPSAQEEGKALGVQRVVGEPVQPFALHAPAPRTLDPAPRVDEIDALVATGEVAGTPESLVVIGAIHLPADTASRFFRRRRRVMSTAKGSPKTPRTRG